MYSPIDKICIKNFRNLGEVEISFDKSPIVCLLGENEAGKTSVIKAFSVCAMHANPRDQKDYIRDGTQMFGVLIQLKDGHKIVRIKTSGANKYQVIRPDGTIWETTKISEGLPVEVQNLMGLIEEPETKEFLHIRTYEDKLLFVVTQASTNYKVMYNALKVEQLTKAIKNGNNEVNTIKSRLSNTDTSIRTLEAQLNTFNIVDLEPLLNVKNRLNKQLLTLDKLEKALELKDNINKCNEKIGLIRLIDTYKLNEIDMSLALNLSAINRVLNRINDVNNLKTKLHEVDSLENIDVSKTEKAKNIIDKIEYIKNITDKAGALVHLDKISEINESLVMQIDRAYILNEKLKSSKEQLNAIDVSQCQEITPSLLESLDKLVRIKQLHDENTQREGIIVQYDNYVGQVVEYLKQCGVAFETCSRCGNDVLIDLDKIS